MSEKYKIVITHVGNGKYKAKVCIKKWFLWFEIGFRTYIYEYDMLPGVISMWKWLYDVPDDRIIIKSVPFNRF